MELEGELSQVYRTAQKHPFLSPEERDAPPLLERAGIEQILPHRDPFLFLQRVTFLDLERRLIAASYLPSLDNPIFAGHFPNEPYWPGTLQLEMMGQAACLLHQKIESGSGKINPLTRILAARFIERIVPGTPVQAIAHWLDDGLFFITIGQCLQKGRICSVAAIQGLK